jgi:hypothetical protein
MIDHQPTMSKVQIIHDYYNAINQGKIEEAEAYIHENSKTTYHGTNGTFTHNKTEATNVGKIEISISEIINVD